MTIMVMGVLMHRTQANSFELVVCQSQGRLRRSVPPISIILSQKCC